MQTSIYWGIPHSRNRVTYCYYVSSMSHQSLKIGTSNPKDRCHPGMRTFAVRSRVPRSSYRTHSEGVALFAFSLLLLLGHALISTPVLSFTQVLISSPRRKRLCHNSSSRPNPVKRGARRDPESPGFIAFFWIPDLTAFVRNDA